MNICSNKKILTIILAFVPLILFASVGPIHAFTITANSPADKDPVVRWSVNLLKERLDILAGHGAAGQSAPAILMQLDTATSNTVGSEGCVIETQPGQVLIRAASPVGLRNGVVTFIEWVMENTYTQLEKPAMIDIDFPVRRGQAADFLANLPRQAIKDKPFFSERCIEFSLLALGVSDLIDPIQTEKKYNMYSGNPSGFKQNAALWREWCDWSARHKMNIITNWPYSAGTNWWEMANDPATAGMSIYTPEEIDAAAKIREELFAYARQCGLCPLMFNYVAGAPTPTIVKNHPELIGTKAVESYPDPFAIASKELNKIFEAQIKAIMRQYPSLGGYHLRWWGESYPDATVKNYREVLGDLTIDIINAAIEARPEAKIIVSGYIRFGGTPEYAARLPKNVTIQTKWGTDWEPTSYPNVAFNTIRDIKKPLLISQAAPAEEMHSIGGVMYKPLQTGIMSYVNRIDQAPNLSGFAISMGEKDTTFITVLNYMAIARLNWEPQSTDVDALVKNYLTLYYGKQTAESAWQAMDTFQTVMEEYCNDYDGICRFLDCYRIHDAYGLDRLEGLHLLQLMSVLPQVRRHSEMMTEAWENMLEARKQLKGQPDLQYQDMEMMMDFWKMFFQTRYLLVQAFHDRFLGLDDEMTDKLNQVIKMDQKMLHVAMNKPNISDDFEMEGMKTARLMPGAINREISQILTMIGRQKGTDVNLMINGGFEMSSDLPPINWRVAADEGRNFQVNLDDLTPAAGNRAAWITQSTGEGKDSLLANETPIAAAPGEELSIEFKLKDCTDLSTTDRVLFTVAYYDENKKSLGNLLSKLIEPSRNGQYKLFKEVVTIPEDGHFIKFSFRLAGAEGNPAPADVLIDEVQVYKIPNADSK